MSEHAQMHGLLGNYWIAHKDSIVCQNCGQQGAIAWEDVLSGDGHRKEMVGITGEFYERLAKKAPHPIELVCNRCGAVQAPSEIQP